MDEPSLPPVEAPGAIPAAPKPQATDEGLAAAQLFVARMRKRKPYATIGIALIIGVVFAIQLAIGHMDTNPAFVRAGALYPVRVFEHGEFWRLASCTFLHADWMHVLFNVYVLIVLGIFVERIIGTPRFLLLYVCSAFAGSVGSLFFLGDGFSVGASGAVWGLLGAHAILAFRPTGLLPALMLPGVRKAAMINLGLNILNSFRPHVDMWAHFAGGAAGAATLYFVLQRGVPPVPERVAEGVPEKVPASRGLWVSGALAMSTLVALLAVALVVGRPFELTDAPTYERVDVPTSRVNVELPSPLLESTQEVAEATGEVEFVAGDLRQHAMSVMVFAMDLPPLSAAELEAELQGLEEAAVPPANASRRSAPERTVLEGNTALVVRDEFESGVHIDRVFAFRPGQLLRVTVLRWPAFLDAAPEDAAVRVARSATTL